MKLRPSLRCIKVGKTHQQFFGKERKRKGRKGMKMIPNGNADPYERLNSSGNDNYIGKIFFLII